MKLQLIKKDINDEIFSNYFKYQNPSLLARDLIKATQAKNEQLVNNVNDGLIDLRKAINKIELSKNENPKKQPIFLKKFWTLINNKKVKDAIRTQLSILNISS